MCASSASSDTDDMTQRSGKVVRAPATTSPCSNGKRRLLSAAQVAVHATQSLATSRWFYLPTSITPALHSSSELSTPLQAGSIVNPLGLSTAERALPPALGVHTAFPYTNIAYRWSLAN